MKSNFPLYKGNQLLSTTMRLDYLRYYFMNYYGGGYVEIKPFNNLWELTFDKINRNNNIYVIGYPELLRGGLDHVNDRFLVEKNYEKV